MSLFPECTLEFSLPGNTLVIGERNEGRIHLDAPEPIPDARHLFLNLRTVAWARYEDEDEDEGEEVSRELLNVPARMDLPDGIPAGRHDYPFYFDVPAWLPPSMQGPACSIEHVLSARLDVDGAVDPRWQVRLPVRPPPVPAARTTAVIRSPPGFHHALVIDVTVTSSVVTEDEPIEGQVALRAGASAKFDAVVLTFARLATIVMGKGDSRRTDLAVVQILAGQFRGDKPIAFHFLPGVERGVSFRSDHIDSSFAIFVAVDWARTPSFQVPIHVVSRESVLEGEGRIERLRRLAQEIASRSGLTAGEFPVFVRGREGSVSFTLTDAPRGGLVRVEATFVFAPLGLDMELRPRGGLDGLRGSLLLPTNLRDRFFLRCEPPEGRFDEAPLGEEGLHSALAGLASVDDVSMSDHHLTFHLTVTDEVEHLVQIASFVAARAKTLAELIAGLPFPRALVAHRPAWEAAAREREGALVPSVPTIADVPLAVRTLAGEEHVFRMHLTTTWKGDVPQAWVDLDLGLLTLPESASRALSGETEQALLEPLRGMFPEMRLVGSSLVRARASRFPEDPRALLSAAEGLVAWARDVRGERRVDAPYR